MNTYFKKQTVLAQDSSSSAHGVDFQNLKESIVSKQTSTTDNAFNAQSIGVCSFFPAPGSYDYLEKHRIRFYMEDAVCLMLDSKTDNQLLFLHNYFDTVRRGQNIIGREFEYVQGSLHNRAAFMSKYSQALHQDGKYSITELHQLAELICPDFPLSIIESTRDIVYHILEIQPLEISNNTIVPSSIFKAALRVCFIYHEMLEYLLGKIKLQFNTFCRCVASSEPWTATELEAIGAGIISCIEQLQFNNCASR
ncbi:hypothetical protein QVD99_006703 [Batrachochytrium dendrobatidis]|nr:hypothetical protein O5D80_005318 [Batrachochytrium dendrobatidis]KAK5666638.1 hypothetical protein QVD99_006703 [Batrachochytrium dendrobatidis]